MSQSSTTNSEDGSKRANSESVAVDSVIDFKGKHFGLESTSEDSDDYLVSGSEGTMIDVERFCHADYRIEQYAHSVLDFSSQYGIDLSISYTAPNITGRPSKYPEYGDFPQTFAMVIEIIKKKILQIQQFFLHISVLTAPGGIELRHVLKKYNLKMYQKYQQKIL